MKSFALLVTLLTVSSGATAAIGGAPVIDVGNARYKGIYNHATNVSHYLGLRFAAAPIGNLRWRAPQPPPQLPGIQDASSDPPQCPQAPMGQAPTNPFPKPAIRSEIQDTEDCLYLNVFMPGGSVPKQRLPVLVWIHGGGYIYWNSSMFNGEDLVHKSDNNILVVTIQYRLGVLGFLSGNDVKANGVLNAGLLDQEYALKWVQKHISKFGGDPDQVTIWGSSSGGGAVLQHSVARDGRTDPPLFRAGMASSMYLPPQYLYNSTVPEAIYELVLSGTGCKNQTHQNAMDCLRKTDLSLIQSVNVDVNESGFFGTFVLSPVVDGEFITQRPTQALLQGKVNGKALLATNVANEGFLVVNQSTAATANVSEFAGNLFPGLEPNHRAMVAQLYAPLGAPIDQINSIMGESIYICPSYWFLRAYPGRGFKAEYVVPPALHGDDVTLSFPSFGTPAVKDVVFARTYSESFIRFVLAMNPNNKFDAAYTPPMWPQYTASSEEMLFNITESGTRDIRAFETNKGVLERCAFWESVSRFTAQ